LAHVDDCSFFSPFLLNFFCLIFSLLFSKKENEKRQSCKNFIKSGSFQKLWLVEFASHIKKYVFDRAQIIIFSSSVV
jgi:hypothetical protein